MSRKMLAFVAVVAAAFAGVLALTACGSSGSSTAEPAAPAPPPPSVETETTAVTTEEATTEQAPAPGAVEVRVENGEPVGGVQTIEVRHGDEVRITVDVDAPQELHLHGYEIEKEAEPGTPVVFEFTADLEGIFDLESHLGDAKLVKLIVNP